MKDAQRARVETRQRAARTLRQAHTKSADVRRAESAADGLAADSLAQRLTLEMLAEGSATSAKRATPRPAPPPTLGAMIDHGWIDGNDFPAETIVTVSVNSGAKGTKIASTDWTGHFFIDGFTGRDGEPRLVPGDQIRATYDANSVQMIVQNVQASADVAGDRVQGTARDAGGRALTNRLINVSIQEYWGAPTELANESGNVQGDARFSIDLSPLDLERGHKIFLTLYNSADGSQNGHRTMRSPYNDVIRMRAQIDHGWIHGGPCPGETTVTVSVNDGSKGTRQFRSESDGDWFYFDGWSGNEGEEPPLQVGDTVKASYGTQLQQMTIQDLEAQVDPAGDRVTGTARSPGGAPLAGHRVQVDIWQDPNQPDPPTSLSATVTPDGSFEVTTGAFDLQRGQWVEVSLYDDPDGSQDANCTIRLPYNSIPTIGTFMEHSWTEVSGMPPETSVTVKMNDGAKGTRETKSDRWGNAWVGWDDDDAPHNPAVGDVITATFGEETIEATVQDLQTTADTVGNRVTGTANVPGGAALAGRKVEAQVFEDWESEPIASGDSVVAPDGSYTVNLVPFDLVRGQHLVVTLWDADDGSSSGHRTMREPYNAIPTLGAMVEHNWIDGQGFPFDTTVTVSLNGGAKGTRTTRTSSSGDLWTDGWEGDERGSDLAVGDRVTAVCGTTTVQMTVQNVAPTANAATNIVSGTARTLGGAVLAGRRVQVSVQPDWGEDEIASGSTTTGGTGAFSINLSPFDLERRQKIFLTMHDAANGSESGHRTMREVYNGAPALTAGLDDEDIRGDDFPFDTTVTVTVNGGAKGTGQAFTGNDGVFDRWDVVPEDWRERTGTRLAPGDVIRAAYGTTSVQMVVQNLVADLDRDGDRVTGTARAPGGTPLAGRAVNAYVMEQPWQDSPSAFAAGVVDPDGTFSLDFSPFDLKRTHEVVVTVWDAADGSNTGHMTVRRPYNGIPFLASGPEWNLVGGEGFPRWTEITLTANGGLKGTTDLFSGPRTDFEVDWGEHGYDNRLRLGDTVAAAFDGTTTEMVIQNVRAYVDCANDDVTGTAHAWDGSPLEGSKVSVGVWNEPWNDESSWETTRVGPDGTWRTHAQDFDIRNDQTVLVQLWDVPNGSERGHRTTRVPTNDPFSLGAYLEGDYVNCSGLRYEATMTVSVNSGAKGTRQSGVAMQGPHIGHAGFGHPEEGGWSGGNPANLVRVGDTISATYLGETTVAVVQNVQANVDVDSDVITGTACTPQGAPLSGRLVEATVGEYQVDNPGRGEATVAPDGSFTIEPAEESEDGPGPPFDVERGHEIEVTLFDAADGTINGHRTIRSPYNDVPTAAVYVDRDIVEVEALPKETTVTVSANDGAKGVKDLATAWEGSLETSNWSGGVGGNRLVAGDWLTFDTTRIARQLGFMEVQDVRAQANIASDTVSGVALRHTGEPNAGDTVRVFVQDEYGPLDDTSLTSEETTVRADGTFTVNLSPFDLEAGQKVSVVLHEPVDGAYLTHQTIRQGQAANAAPTSLGLSTTSSSSLGYGARIALRGTLLSAGGILGSRDDVWVEKSYNGTTWYRDGRAAWNSSASRYEASRVVTQNARYRMRFAGDWDYGPSASSALLFRCRAYLGRPWLVPTSPVRGRTFTAYGYLKPRHSGTTRLYFYRYVSGKWRYYTYKNATNYNYLTYTRYRLAWRLPYAGRWYVKAYHSDAGHLPTWSPVAYVTVR